MPIYVLLHRSVHLDICSLKPRVNVKATDNAKVNDFAKEVLLWRKSMIILFVHDAKRWRDRPVFTNAHRTIQRHFSPQASLQQDGYALLNAESVLMAWPIARQQTATLTNITSSEFQCGWQK